jgi:hypothetical protein
MFSNIYQLQHPLFPVGINDVGFDVTGGDGGAYVGFSGGVAVGF